MNDDYAEDGEQGANIIEVFMPTYIMKPSEDEKFPVAQCKDIINQVLQSELDAKEYDQDEAKEWSINISEAIKLKVKEECNIPRYKIVVQVTTGEMKDQGVRVASRSLWDTATDNYASSSFQNVSFP